MGIISKIVKSDDSVLLKFEKPEKEGFGVGVSQEIDYYVENGILKLIFKDGLEFFISDLTLEELNIAETSRMLVVMEVGKDSRVWRIYTAFKCNKAA